MMKEFFQKLEPEQIGLRKRILEICYERKLSHLGSCLSAVDIIDAVYDIKKPDERFVLSAGHAGIALYAVLEKNGLVTAEQIKQLNVHPDRNLSLGIEVSTGSLGQGLPIALGMALADRNKNVYCVISDGECAEGSVFESFSIAGEQGVDNLKVVVNANGFGAYREINRAALVRKIRGFDWGVYEVYGHNKNQIKQSLATQKCSSPTAIVAYTIVEQLPFLSGIDAHYHTMTEDDIRTANELIIIQ